MRRKDREITSLDAIEAILRDSVVCRLALHGGEYPYIVPMNFGYVRDGDRFTLYFHCAKEGQKLDLIRENPRAAFEVECDVRVVRGDRPDAYTTAYRSVIGQGVLSAVEGAEAAKGLEALMRQCVPDQTFHFDDRTTGAVTVLRLDVATVTGKQNLK